MDLCSEETHFIYVQSLTLGILFSHEYLTFHAHQCCCSCSCHAVLACAGLSDHTSLAHFFCQKHLPKYVVDFMGSCVVQILTFQIDLGSAKVLGHMCRIVKTGRSSCVFIKKLCELTVEFRVIFVVVVCFLKLQNGVHQCFRDVLSAMDAESSF